MSKADEVYASHTGSDGTFRTAVPNNQVARDREIFDTAWEAGAEYQRQQQDPKPVE